MPTRAKDQWSDQSMPGMTPGAVPPWLGNGASARKAATVRPAHEGARGDQAHEGHEVALARVKEAQGPRVALAALRVAVEAEGLEREHAEHRLAGGLEALGVDEAAHELGLEEGRLLVDE